MHSFIPLTEIQHNALTGSMLGDGHLNIGPNNINANFMIGRSIKDKKYLQYEADIFKNFLRPRYKNGVISTRSFSKRDNVIREGCGFETVSSPTLTPYHNLWYSYDDQKEKFVKTIPNSLQLNGQIIAHWLCDDGSMDYNKLPYRLKTEISTHGFAHAEVEFLCKLLNDRYNEDFLCRPKNRNGKTYWIIKAYDSACRVMFADIDPYFKMERKRIWDKTESRFWNDPPERQRSRTKALARRKEMIEEVIELKQDIKLMDLIDKLGYSNKGKTEYKCINRLLQPYLDDGSITKFYDKYDNNTCTIKIKKE